MADRYVEISKDEMEKFVMNSYRPYRPKPGRIGNQLTYTLQVGPNVGVRIHTSLSIGREEVRGVGDDAIEVFLVSLKVKGKGEYLMTKATQKKHGIVLVMRTKNWRSALDDRVDKLIDIYEDSEDYWEKRAEGVAPAASGPSPKQMEFIQKLVSMVFQRKLQGQIHWKDFGLDGSTEPKDFSMLDGGRDGSASRLITHLRDALTEFEARAEHDRIQNDQRSQQPAPRPQQNPGGGPTDAQIERLKYHLSGKAWLWQKHNLDRKFGPMPNGPDDFRRRFTQEQAAEIIKVFDDSLRAWQQSRRRSASEELAEWGDIAEDDADAFYGPVAN